MRTCCCACVIASKLSAVVSRQCERIAVKATPGLPPSPVSVFVSISLDFSSLTQHSPNHQQLNRSETRGIQKGDSRLVLWEDEDDGDDDDDDARLTEDVLTPLQGAEDWTGSSEVRA